MGLKSVFREYFTFNRRERNGVFVLLSIILILILYLSFSDLFFSHGKTDFSEFDKEVARFEAELNNRNDGVLSETKNYFTHENLPDESSAERFFFNPNNLPEDDWKRLGLSDKQIKVIKNYESKGGEFRIKEDLGKMYCISPALYSSLEQYIQIPAVTGVLNRHVKDSSLRETAKTGEEIVELNSADTIQLDKLKGIGTVFAKRIISYRELLGGFVAKEQLLDVYGFDKIRYDGLSSAVFVDDSKVKKININSAAFEELKQHPYIKHNLASLILNYRRQHGNYNSVEDIKQLDLMNEKLFAKISPYLTIQ